MKSLLVVGLALAAMAIALPAHGTTNMTTATTNTQSRDLSSTEAVAVGAVTHAETYKFQDGYGTYSGQGSNKIEAQSDAREKCINNQVAGYEARHGVTPDADTADLMIDACINK